MFDYDGTLRPLFCDSGSDKQDAKRRVRDVVSYALDHGHAIGINTARYVLTAKHKHYLKWLGIDVKALPKGAVQLGGMTSRQKVKNLERIQDTYEAIYGPIPRHHVMFFDDKKRNVDAARDAGFHAVLVEPTVTGGCLAVTLNI